MQYFTDLMDLNPFTFNIENDRRQKQDFHLKFHIFDKIFTYVSLPCFKNILKLAHSTEGIYMSQKLFSSHCLIIAF